MSDSKDSILDWMSLREKIIIDSPFIKVLQRDCSAVADPSKTHRFFVLQSKDWCNIIPITTEGKVVLIRQFRAGTQSQTLEIPGGVVDPSDPKTQAAALRELEEETGYSLIPGGQCTPLGSTHPNPAIQDNQCHSFIVGPVEKKTEQKLDPGELIAVEEVAIEDIPRLILSGEMDHALILNAFFFLLLRDPQIQNQLIKSLYKFS